MGCINCIENAPWEHKVHIILYFGNFILLWSKNALIFNSIYLIENITGRTALVPDGNFFYQNF